MFDKISFAFHFL